MGLIARYIFRRAAIAFLASLAVLASVVWVTQTLRQLDLVTSKGQALGMFLSITLLAVPFLALLITPFAIVIATIVTLSNLSADSEMIAMHASGTSRGFILRPILILGVAVGLFSAFLALWAAPTGLQAVRVALTQVQVDMVATIIKPGRFIEMEPGLTFHIRNRNSSGDIEGLVLDDQRDPDRGFTYLAKEGQIAQAIGRTLLVMKDGTIQRSNKKDHSLSIVRFDTYAFDLTTLTPAGVAPVFRPSERSTYDLMTTTPDENSSEMNSGRIRAELADRFSQPLYPLAFALVVFLFLGEPRTNRQSRATSVLGAVITVAAIRLGGFGASTMAIHSPLGAVLMFALPIATIVLAGGVILSDARIGLPRPIAAVIDAVSDLLTRLAARAGATGNA